MRNHSNNKSHPLYRTWLRMRDRCNNPNNPDYPNYGGRGIKVCDRWSDFQLFALDMGPKPGPEYSIDRENNDEDYKPGNCRWATLAQQSRNRRDNRLVTYEGRTQCVSDWADEIGLSKEALRERLDKGWAVERALTSPRHHIPDRKGAVILTYQGRTQCLSHWAEELGIGFTTLQYRISAGWPVEKALGTPSRRKR